MNLRDKLRAVSGAGPGRPERPEQQTKDCRHFAVYRPEEEFPGARELTRDTLALMSEKKMPADETTRRHTDCVIGCLHRAKRDSQGEERAAPA